MTTFIDGKTPAQLDKVIAVFCDDEQADLRAKGKESEHKHYAWLVKANAGDPFWADAVVKQLQAQK